MERAEREQLRGRRVVLVYCTDQYTDLEPGVEGTVSLIDDMGTWHIRWDNGSTLGMIAEAGDRWELLPA